MPLHDLTHTIALPHCIITSLNGMSCHAICHMSRHMFCHKSRHIPLRRSTACITSHTIALPHSYSLWLKKTYHCITSLTYHCITSLIFAIACLRLVASIKLSASFAEYSLFYRALLQKRPIILSTLLTEAKAYERRFVVMHKTEQVVCISNSRLLYICSIDDWTATQQTSRIVSCSVADKSNSLLFTLAIRDHMFGCTRQRI